MENKWHLSKFSFVMYVDGETEVPESYTDIQDSCIRLLSRGAEKLKDTVQNTKLHES